MECKHKNKLNNSNFCKVECYYCTFQIEAECKRKHPEYFMDDIKKMSKEQIIALLYTLSDEYLATNYNKNANDMAYHSGLKDGIEGFRRYMLYYLEHCCE